MLSRARNEMHTCTCRETRSFISSSRAAEDGAALKQAAQTAAAVSNMSDASALEEKATALQAQLDAANSDAAISFRALFFAPPIRISPFKGPLP